MAQQLPRLMTLREVARYLRLHPMTVYKWVREGRIPMGKIGGQWFVTTERLAQWVQTVGAPTSGVRQTPGGTG